MANCKYCKELPSTPTSNYNSLKVARVKTLPQVFKKCRSQSQLQMISLEVDKSGLPQQPLPDLYLPLQKSSQLLSRSHNFCRNLFCSTCPLQHHNMWHQILNFFFPNISVVPMAFQYSFFYWPSFSNGVDTFMYPSDVYKKYIPSLFRKFFFML